MFFKGVDGAALSAVVEVDRSYRRRVDALVVVTQPHPAQREPTLLPALRITTEIACIQLTTTAMLACSVSS